jgi:tetratricopeptide (TPR) repeat protein
MNLLQKKRLPFILSAAMLLACGANHSNPSKEQIDQLHLTRGQAIACGPPENEFGMVDFEITASEPVKKDFNTAVELLHSFEYEEAEKVFAKIIDESPECAMAYWGVAMCNFHQLWEPPSEINLIKGSKAIVIANSIARKSERESAYIHAVGEYYKDWQTIDPLVRAVNFEKAMQHLHTQYPDDKEAAVFYALALDASAVPTDKSYTNQKKAGDILNALYVTTPNHPGIIHYIIHNYDYPGIASLALPAARKYAAVAPSSAHALHMPSHIFTRLGLWDDCIQSNKKSVAAAQCYAESAGIKGHWDEELHGLDYLVYAYLQKGDNHAAEELLKYIATIHEVYPVNFKEAYTFAAAPSRMALENKNWQEATQLSLQPAGFPWKKFPWQAAIIHFARLLGAAHMGDLPSAQSELVKLNVLHDTLQNQKDVYKSKQVAIQIKSGEAWIMFMKKNYPDALNLMKTAAEMEDSTSKHPVTPGEVLPARELYADMLLQMKQNRNALQAYLEVLQQRPNRFNSLYGAGISAEKSGDVPMAVLYYEQLMTIADSTSNRPELIAAKSFLKKNPIMRKDKD